MLVPLALVGVIVLTNATNWVALAFFLGIAAAVAATGFLGYGVVDAWEQRRSRGQLPPRPRRDGRKLEGRRAVRVGADPARPGARIDQNRVDLRAHLPRGTRPVPVAG